MSEMTEEDEAYYGKTTEKWNVYVAILLYPGKLTPQEYAELCVKHLEWCSQNGIQQVVHAAYKMKQTTEEVNDIVSKIVTSIKTP